MKPFLAKLSDPGGLAWMTEDTAESNSEGY